MECNRIVQIMLNCGIEKRVKRPPGLWDMIGYKEMCWVAKLGLRVNLAHVRKLKSNAFSYV